MQKVEDYKRLAIEARTKAAATRNENVKRQLLEIAEEWDALAEARLAVIALKSGRAKRKPH
jgi:hypothetical protein